MGIATVMATWLLTLLFFYCKSSNLLIVISQSSIYMCFRFVHFRLVSTSDICSRITSIQGGCNETLYLRGKTRSSHRDLISRILGYMTVTLGNSHRSNMLSIWRSTVPSLSSYFLPSTFF